MELCSTPKSFSQLLNICAERKICRLYTLHEARTNQFLNFMPTLKVSCSIRLNNSILTMKMGKAQLGWPLERKRLRCCYDDVMIHQRWNNLIYFSCLSCKNCCFVIYTHTVNEYRIGTRWIPKIEKIFCYCFFFVIKTWKWIILWIMKYESWTQTCEAAKIN